MRTNEEDDDDEDDDDEDEEGEDEEGEDEDENEDDDPLPAGNLLSGGGARGGPGADRTWACQGVGDGGGPTGKFQGFQWCWCLPIPC